jgi:hypothetical protein
MMLISGMQMKKVDDVYVAAYRSCYVNIKTISSLRVIAADCKASNGDIEWWTLFVFNTNDSEIIHLAVDNPDAVYAYLLENSI